MTVDIGDFRIVTASAYAGMMAPLTRHPATACVLSGDTDTDRRDDGVAALSLEALDGVRRRWRLGDVARLADFVPKVLSHAPADRRPALLVPPRVTAAWEQAAVAWPDEIRLLGRSAAEVSAIADDKVFVREQLARLGVPVPDSVVVAAAELPTAYRRAVARLGSPFVLQAPQGAGGRGTYLIESERDLLQAGRRSGAVQRWLLSAYAGDVTINVAGLVHAGGVEVWPASVQASGIAEVGSGYGAYCGSDFAAANQLPPAVRAAARHHTVHIGQWLHGIGHRGIFGADIAVAGAAISFLEVNPRVQGSSWLLSEAQQRHGETGCLVQHVRALLGRADAGRGAGGDGGPAGDGDESGLGLAGLGLAGLGLTGSQLLVRWTGAAGRVRATPGSGANRVPGIGATVAVTGLPAAGTVITPGAISARLHTDDSLVEPDGRRLRPAIREFLRTWSTGFAVDADA